MQKVASEIQRSKKTIDDLLELARNGPLQRRATPARDFIAHTVATAALPATVQLSVTAPDDVMLDADPDQLARVLTNLLANASQAMNDEGHVSIEAQREGTATVLVVRDDGPGVPAELRERIFEALFTTKAKGNGLGLALCRRIAEAHGGTVTLEPAERGAVFQIMIPDSKPTEIT